MITCTSIVRHGDTRLVVTGTGATRSEALNAAVHLTDIGYKPSAPNVAGAHELLARWDKGERPAPLSTVIRSATGYAHLSFDDDGGPRIQIGWCDFTFTTPAPVRLWAISAHVDTTTPGKDGFTVCRQVPTFYLDPSVQGIVDEHHAIKIAHDILHTAAGDSEDVHFNVGAEPIY